MLKRALRRSYVAALVFLPQAALAQRHQPEPPIPVAERTALVDSIRSALARYYVFPDTAKLMGGQLADRHRSGAYDFITARSALGNALTADIKSVYADAHLRIDYDPEQARAMTDTTRRERRDNTARDRRNNYNFKHVQILPGNIGYLEFNQFADTSREARRTIRAAMQFVANTDALILDLRDNRGGSAAMSTEIASYFVNGRTKWSDTYNRLNDRWSEGWFENLPEITGGIYLGMPLTILTSRWTYSAAEGLAYGLKYGRGARIVGEPTAGGAHVLRRVALGGGFIGFIPYIRSANVVTKTDWEGSGVVPDVPTPAPDALLRAQEAILTERLPAASDSTARFAIQWAIDEARTAAHDVDIPARQLEEFVGQFEEYVFSVRNNRLYCVNTSRNRKTDRLVPISQTRFSIDHESHVEFIRDTSGKVNAARLYWSDGWTDPLKRTVKQ